MCRFLNIERSLVYYHLNKEDSTSSNEELIITKHIKNIFKRSRNNYGTRKIKKELDKLEYKISRRRISRIMKENSLVSNYTVA
ncbi:transposase [Clostridium putrefaciens]|uniref:Transposase n=1 Tax=Clostridium putrefaciens TaxID=99675 RepID=A0A381J7X7_9CLOT|nr:transposase [Clostridium putrefaciens]